MTKARMLALFIFIFVMAGFAPSQSVQLIDTSMVEGLKIQSPTRVKAGNYFQVKLTSKSGKISGVCWWDWQLSKGFSGPSDFKMKSGVATVKILPIQPGAGRMSFYCGLSRSKARVGGSTDIYIAP
jgi:hypothetical protein